MSYLNSPTGKLISDVRIEQLDTIDTDLDQLSEPFSSIQLNNTDSSEGSTAYHTEIPSDTLDSSTIQSLDLIQGFVTKRGAEYLTVEGSPFRIPHKRLDIGFTPQYPLDKSTQPTFLSSASAKNISLSDPLLVLRPVSSAVTAAVKNEVIHQDRKVSVIISGGKHDTGHHQENFMRLALLVGSEVGCLGREAVAPHIDIIDDTTHPRKANLVDLLRVHDYEYLNHVETKAKMSDAASATEIIKDHNKLIMPSFYAPTGQLDADTPLGVSSLDAAKSFCGAAMTAVDMAMDKSNDKRRDCILVLGRPPGHHAGANGCVVSDYYWRRPDMSSSGFCLLNTVAVAAAYARCQYGSQVNLISTSSTQHYPPKIAIVDFDVHHGNGTEDIIRNLQPRSIHLPLPSSWAPVSKTIYKPWLNEHDSKEVLFASINLVAEDRFYPCSGNDSSHDNIINIGLTPIGPGPWDQRARAKLSSKEKAELCSQASEEFRRKIETILIPALEQFQPDLLFFSAGFDAHVDDFYHFLTENDFHWVTEKLCDIVEKCNGAVVSVLEGGYSLSSPLPSTARATKAVAAKPAASTVMTAKAQALAEGVKYAQKPGDGGLVKGVLAHIAALAKKEAWVKS